MMSCPMTTNYYYTTYSVYVLNAVKLGRQQRSTDNDELSSQSLVSITSMVLRAKTTLREY